MSDIATLMSRNPLELLDRDIDEIIAVMRRQRTTFNSAPAAAPAKLTKKETEAKSAGLGLSLNLELKK